MSAVSLHFCYHNFCRIHTSLGTTPAVAAGILNEEWDIDMIIDLIEIDENSKSRKRGPYKKRGEIDFT